MDKKQLEQIPLMQAEIKSLSRRIKNWPIGIVWDWHYEYPNGFPIVKNEFGNADCQHLHDKLNNRLTALQIALYEAECYLDTLDAEIGEILRLRYRDGMKYEDIGRELGYDKSVICRRIKAHWETCNQNNR